jgi:hypothetical protein
MAFTRTEGTIRVTPGAVMSALMRFETAEGAEVVVEVDRVPPGAKLVARGGNRLAEAGETFDGALQGIRSAADAALRVFRDGALRPDGVELEFGVKLTGEAGAVIAKTSMEGHITVKLSWGAQDAGALAGAAVPPDTTRHSGTPVP